MKETRGRTNCPAYIVGAACPLCPGQARASRSAPWRRCRGRADVEEVKFVGDGRYPQFGTMRGGGSIYYTLEATPAPAASGRAN